MLTNTKLFQEVGNYFRENKTYTRYPENSYGYIEFWKEEHKKCLEGVSVGNFKIPGAYYFYLNYKPILRKVKSSNRKILDFPQFTDVDLEYFNLIERARKEGKGIILVKPRRIGFTYKNSSLAEYEYNFFPNSKTFLSAFESKYSLSLMDMTLHGLNFLDDHTPWRKQRNPDTRTHIRSRYKENDSGSEVWRGYDSEIEVLTFKNNPFAGAGKSGSLFIFDEVGIFPNIIQSYNISEPTWKDGDTVTGLPILGGSAGDMEGGSLEFSQMFYNPGDYNLLSMDNIWDEGKENTKCGWFIPASRMRFGKYKDVSGKYPERTGEDMVDDDGNSVEDLALQSVLDFRTTKNESKKALKDAITQYPLNTREAFLRRTSNFFPTKDIMYRLSEVENNVILKKSFYTGDLMFQEGEKVPYLIPNEVNKAITDFPLRNVDEIEGAIEIYEKPKTDGSGNVKAGRYILGNDPIDDDGNSNIENSLQSTLVFDLYTDRIVAEYTGRTSDVRIYYENVRRLALYYNAIINYENNKKGLFGYFNNMNSLYLLCDMPKYLKDTELVKAESIGNKSKGTPSGSKYMIKHYEDLINSYLLSQAFDKEPGINNIHTLRGEALMKELIAYDRDVNTDRVSALAMVLVLREELFKVIDRKENKEENIFNDDFFNRNKRANIFNTINIDTKNKSKILRF